MEVLIDKIERNHSPIDIAVTDIGGVATESAIEQLDPIVGNKYDPSLPIEEAVEWDVVLENLSEGRELPQKDKPFWGIGFVGELKPDADITKLLWHDSLALAAAKKTPGFIDYFGGATDENLNATSFCIWDNPEGIAMVARDTDHQAAVRITAEMYAKHQLVRFLLYEQDGEAVFERLE